MNPRYIKRMQSISSSQCVFASLHRRCIISNGLSVKVFVPAMAKFVLTTAVLLIIAATAVIAAPAEGEFEQLELSQGFEPFNEEEVAGEESHLRFRRVTCDLLSFKGVVGDSACAANCLSMGKAGGRCNNGVCECRKTTFGELWNRRFG